MNRKAGHRRTEQRKARGLSWSRAALMLAGLGLVGAAVFAEGLGLDRHGGWGRTRLGVLLAGVAILVLVAAYRFFHAHLQDAWRRFGSSLAAHPVGARMRGSPLAALPGLVREYRICGWLMLLVLLFYFWFASSGRWQQIDSTTHHYYLQATGFAQGKLSLSVDPSPKLAELPDPYNFHARAGIKALRDVSYFNGKYYLYFGPVPALVLIALTPFLGWWISDATLNFVFACGIFVALSLLAIGLWHRYFRMVPKWMLHASVLVLGLSGPLLFLRHNFESAKFYEASISGGQFFLAWGLVAALAAAEATRRPLWGFAAAGILWGLAAGSRLLLAPAVAFLVLVTSFRWLRTRGWTLRKMRTLLPLAVFPLLAILALGWFNWARFGSVTETGAYYILSSRSNFQEDYSSLTSARYIVPNLYNYLLNPLVFRSEFPYLRVRYGSQDPLPGIVDVPPTYEAQPVMGVVYAMPFVLFAVLAIARAVPAFRRRPSHGRGADAERAWNLNVITWTLAGASLLSFAALMTFFWVAIRYEQDFLPLLLMLAVIGFWRGYEWISQGPAALRLYELLGAGLTLLSVVFGALLGLSTHAGLSAAVPAALARLLP